MRVLWIIVASFVVLFLMVYIIASEEYYVVAVHVLDKNVIVWNKTIYELDIDGSLSKGKAMLVVKGSEPLVIMQNGKAYIIKEYKVIKKIENPSIWYLSNWKFSTKGFLKNPQFIYKPLEDFSTLLLV